MANEFLKAERIAAAALGLLERAVILPALVWRDAGGDFAGAGGDTISIRVPARTTARTRTLRAARVPGTPIITMDNLAETKVDVTLDEAVYNAVPVTDEELTLDIVNFGQQVLSPQVTAVAEGLENKLAAEMVGATYATTLDLDTVDPYNSLVDARVAMNKANVPMAQRTCVVGADLEGYFLKSKHISEADKSGSDSALRDAVIGRVAGFGNVYISNALPSNVGFCFHRTAYVMSTRAPAVPDGASFGASQVHQGLAMRWLRDYDFLLVQDRSLVDAYVGTNIIADGPDSNEVQTVTLTGIPTGGTFTLTLGADTTGAIAYNATAATVAAAIVAGTAAAAGDVAVTGAAGGPWTVTFADTMAGTNVAAMTGSGASLTGGTDPAVVVATATEGAVPTFVRAVKLVAA